MAVHFCKSGRSPQCPPAMANGKSHNLKKESKDGCLYRKRTAAIFLKSFEFVMWYATIQACEFC
jgi:hypothetical protein